VSFLRRVDSGFVVHASTLEDAERDDLRRGVVGSRTDSVIQIGGHPHAIYAEPIGDDVLVVLQRPLAEALQPYNRLVINPLRRWWYRACSWCWPAATCGSRVPPDHFPENGGPRPPLSVTDLPA
jgi:hypothetical protein